MFGGGTKFENPDIFESMKFVQSFFALSQAYLTQRHRREFESECAFELAGVNTCACLLELVGACVCEFVLACVHMCVSVSVCA